MHCPERYFRQAPIMACLPPLCWLKWISSILMTFCLAGLAGNVYAITAPEILEQVTKQSLNNNIRVVLTIKAFKGQKVISSHALWLIVRVEEGNLSYFLDFYEPKESKGLRFLFLEQAGQEPATYMYLPATGKTMALALDDPAFDVGSTGLTTEDFQAFFSKSQPEETVREEAFLFP